MWIVRKMVITGAAVITAGPAWHVKSVAQKNAASGVGAAALWPISKFISNQQQS